MVPSTFRFLKVLFSRTRAGSASRRRTPKHRSGRPRRPLELERFEDRCLPAVVAPPAGLISWWPGEAHASDIQGPTYEHGTLQNGVSFAAGKVGQAFNFDGINDYVNVGTSAAFDLADFTLQAWVNISPADNVGERRIISRDDVLAVGPDGDRELYTLKSSSVAGGSGRPIFAIEKGGVLTVAAATTPLTAGFHHIAGVRSGNTVRLYVDGVEVDAEISSISGVLSPEAPLVLGQVSPAFNGEFFKGRIDEPALFNRALTAAEVQAIFNAGSDGMLKPATSVWEAASGKLPTEVCPPWTLFDTAGPEDPVLSEGKLTISTSPASETMGFIQTAPDIAMPGTIVIEARVKFVSGSSTVLNRAPINIGFTTAPNVGNVLFIDADEMWFNNASDAKGTGAAVAVVNTSDAFHTYRIEVSGTASGSVIRAFYDGVLKITGTTVTNANLNGGVPRVFWGDGTLGALGTSEWEFVRHNASIVTCADNDPPTIAADVAAVTADEGGVARNTGTFSDLQGNGTVTITASVGSVTQNNTDGTWSWSLAAADGPAGPVTVTITATDDQGAASNATFNYSVTNVAPSISLAGAAAVNEGAPFTLNLGAVTDPGQDVITAYTIHWGDGTSDTFSGSPAHTVKTHTYADGPANHTYNVAVTDEDGTFLAGSLSVLVLNVTPTIALSGAGSVNEGSPYTLDLGAITDPGLDTVSAFTVNWGDGVVENFSGNPAGTSKTHTYADGPGGYTIAVSLTDEDGTHQAAGVLGLVVDNVAPALADATFEVVENSPGGTLVGAVTGTDPGADTLSYAIVGGTGATAFTIDPNTGQIRVADSAQLDFESTPGFTLEVTVTDDDFATGMAVVTINLINKASISGTVYVDTNQNGLYEANEMGIDCVHVELLDGSGAPLLDGQGNPVRAETSGGGFYLFEDLDPGTYRVRELQPTGVNDGAEQLGSLGGSIVANDTMQLTLTHIDAFDYVFAEIGQQVTSGDTAGIGFWHNKHGQALITAGGTALAQWLSANFDNIFGNALAGADGAAVAAFYKDQLFKQKGQQSAGSAKVDAQFMALALSTFFTNRCLAGDVAASYGFNVTDTGIGTKVVNVGSSGAAFGVANNSNLTIMQLLLATNSLTDTSNSLSGFAHTYDRNGDGVIDAEEAQLRALANSLYGSINGQGGI